MSETVIGLTADGKKIVHKVTTGPTSYSSGGFTVRITELNRIDAVSVSIRTNLKVDDLVHVVDYSVSDNTITFTVYYINVTASSPVSWSEVSDGTDISALTLEIIAIGV